MLDQSFSSHNFERIFLVENRKGNINKNYLPEEYYTKNDEFNEVVEEKEDLKSLLGELDSTQLDSFAIRLEEINKAKALIRIDAFNRIAIEVQHKSYSFGLEYVQKHDAFRVPKNSPSAFFAIKQLQRNLNKTFKVKQASRNQIIQQLYGLLKDGYPKVVIRTDIKSFYESIPQSRLINKLEENHLLSFESLKMIKKLLVSYESIKDSTSIDAGKGIPRGVGISAYLSELYLGEVDDKIRQLDDLVFYTRYVDDIVAIFIPRSPTNIPDYLSNIKEIIEGEELRLNDGTGGTENKTDQLDLHSGIVGDITEDLSYLGYRFRLEKRDKRTDVKIEISENKVNRYISRIEKAIGEYNSSSKHNEKIARKMLIDRLRFLAGNYHLNRRKRTIKAGLFYSNSQLCLDSRSRYYSLDKIQGNFIRMIRNDLNPYHKLGIDKLNLGNYILDIIDFKKGFFNKQTTFHTFGMSPKETIYYNRKHGEELTKFELIKSIWHNV